MSINEVYGPLRHEGEIEDAVLATLQTWLPHYLERVAEYYDWDPIDEPYSWVVVSEYDRFPDEALPAIIVMVPRTSEVPDNKGNGKWDADYALTVFAEVAAPDGASARRLSQLYGAAVLGSLMHNRKLAEGIAITEWLGGNNGTLEIDEASRRTRCGHEHFFKVRMRDVVDAMSGPATSTPPSPAPTQLPEITDVDVSVTHMADEQS